MDRADREKEAYDEGKVWEVNDAWHRRFSHVFQCPNTLRHERLSEEILRENVRGKDVLEIGCGDGENAARISAMGSAFVYGIDVSPAVVSRAREREIKGRMEFAVADAHEKIPRRFDVIFGQSAIHHIASGTSCRGFTARP